MSFKFESDVDWIFMFCKKCWDYKKFIFLKPISFIDEDEHIGKCISCLNEQILPKKEGLNYYLQLNENNN